MNSIRRQWWRVAVAIGLALWLLLRGYLVTPVYADQHHIPTYKAEIFGLTQPDRKSPKSTILEPWESLLYPEKSPIALTTDKAEPEIKIEITAAQYVAPAPKPAPRPASTGVRYNNFPFGQCTWGVANLRPVSWSGNAREWLGNARAMGYATGSTPRVGSIMVSLESPLGHVAYVTGVNSNGSFTVKEMNAYFNGGGWGKYSFRTIYPGTINIIGFIL